MRFGKSLPVGILEALVKYSAKLDEAEKKIYGADTFKGKMLLWVEKLPSAHYVLYGNIKEKWYAEYFDSEGKWLGDAMNDQAFDFKDLSTYLGGDD